MDRPSEVDGELLDELLRVSAPRVTADSRAQRKALRSLTYRVRQRGQLRFRKSMIGGAAVVLICGSAGAAVATGIFGPGPQATVHPSSGACQATYTVDAADEEVPNVTARQTARTLEAARRWLQNFDVNTISEEKALTKYRAAEDRALAKLDPSDTVRSDDREARTGAVGSEIYRQLSTYLRAQSLPPSAVQIDSTDDCPAEPAP